jgi:hypothetical protein
MRHFCHCLVPGLGKRKKTTSFQTELHFTRGTLKQASKAMLSAVENLATMRGEVGKSLPSGVAGASDMIYKRSGKGKVDDSGYRKEKINCCNKSKSCTCFFYS